MTPTRAQYILDEKLPFGELKYAFSKFGGVTHDDGITVEEDTHIKAVWKEMTGYTCYTDALTRIANGEAS